MLKKVLIANRGEIALRVIRACHESGIEAVAVFSEADRMSPHLWEADEAYGIGPAPAAESYLRGDRIVEVARRAGAQAIHPGYGFLAETPAFAEACEEAGLIFVGPPPAAVRLMGDKVRARQAMRAAGVAVVPGVEEGIEDPAAALRAAERLGYPVMLKPVGGGGGKGMRVVAGPSGMEAALRGARSEAAKAFADERVYMEKYIAGPRHIEVQVLADGHGAVVPLGERECTIQRRHQKMIEESPSPVVTPEIRAALERTAVEAARAAGYRSAGTVEFVMDGQGTFYFLEMNTRLQVEHPVTEMVTGVDIVQWQLRIAAGEPLTVREGKTRPRGWAIECRISSEDPFNDFLPSAGTITACDLPGGPGVRVDCGVVAGTPVTLFYDPLLLKLVTWAADRASCVRRMARALAETRIGGVRTTIPFHLRVMEDPAFQAGTFTTEFLAERQDLLAPRPGEPDEEAAAVAAVVAQGAGAGAGEVSARTVESPVSGAAAPSRDAWREAGRREGLSREAAWRVLRDGRSARGPV